jgi:hypothetical protein
LHLRRSDNCRLSRKLGFLIPNHDLRGRDLLLGNLGQLSFGRFDLVVIAASATASGLPCS